MRAQFPSTGDRRGFTLIELLVVMAIVATLLAVVAPSYFEHLDHSREVALQQSLTTMRDAIDKFRADTGAYPKDLQELVARRYLRSVPSDPLTEKSDTWKIVRPREGEEGGMGDVRSGASGRSRDGREYGEL